MAGGLLQNKIFIVFEYIRISLITLINPTGNEPPNETELTTEAN